MNYSWHDNSQSEKAKLANLGSFLPSFPGENHLKHVFPVPEVYENVTMIDSGVSMNRKHPISFKHCQMIFIISIHRSLFTYAKQGQLISITLCMCYKWMHFLSTNYNMAKYEVTFIVLFLTFAAFSCCFGQSPFRKFEYKYSFKGPHLIQKDETVPFWKYGGSKYVIGIWGLTWFNTAAELRVSVRDLMGRCAAESASVLPQRGGLAELSAVCVWL